MSQQHGVEIPCDLEHAEILVTAAPAELGKRQSLSGAPDLQRCLIQFGDIVDESVKTGHLSKIGELRYQTYRYLADAPVRMTMLAFVFDLFPRQNARVDTFTVGF